MGWEPSKGSLLPSMWSGEERMEITNISPPQPLRWDWRRGCSATRCPCHGLSPKTVAGQSHRNMLLPGPRLDVGLAFLVTQEPMSKYVFPFPQGPPSSLSSPSSPSSRPLTASPACACPYSHFCLSPTVIASSGTLPLPPA